ncbi:MAG: hypothetical protein ACK5LX_00745 [Oscillospiraceae bacterium]
MNGIIETTATIQAKTFANTVYAAYENSFDKLSLMEHTLCHLFDILESGQLLSALQTLFVALDCTTIDKSLCEDENAADIFTLAFMNAFEDTVLEIGFSEQEG